MYRSTQEKYDLWNDRSKDFGRASFGYVAVGIVLIFLAAGGIVPAAFAGVASLAFMVAGVVTLVGMIVCETERDMYRRIS